MYFLVHSSAIQAASMDYNLIIRMLTNWKSMQMPLIQFFSLPLSASVHRRLKNYDWFDSESIAMEFFKDKNAV